MDMKMAMLRMKNFADSLKTETIGKVAIKDGVMYATDGRIAVRWRAFKPGECGDDVPEKYPMAAIDGFLEGVNDVKTWYSMDEDAYKAIEGNFLEAFRKERIRMEQERRDRYVLLTCPSCGDAVYYDKWENSLVDEPEDDGDLLHLKEVTFPVGMKFGKVGMMIGCGYLYCIHLFGPDVQFAPEPKKEGATARLLFRSQVNDMSGILMPLRAEGGKVKCPGLVMNECKA